MLDKGVCNYLYNLNNSDAGITRSCSHVAMINDNLLSQQKYNLLLVGYIPIHLKKKIQFLCTYLTYK